MIDSVTIPGDHALRAVFQRFEIPSQQPSLERIAAALRIENARLTRELAEAARTLARLRTQLAAATGKLASPEPPADYDPHDAPPAKPAKVRPVKREPAYKRIPGGWLVAVLRGREPMTQKEIAKLTGKSGDSVATAIVKYRDAIEKTGPMHGRRYALKRGA